MTLKIVLIILVILFAGLMAVGIIDGNRFIIVEDEFELKGIRKKCRFVMLSDLHNKEYGENNKKVIKAVENVKPEFVVIVGDQVTSHVNEPIDVGVNLVNSLSQKYKVYYANGNHETKIKVCKDIFGDRYDELVQRVKHPNVTMLVNDDCVLENYGIKLYGLELERKYFKRFKKRPLDAGCLSEKIGKPDERYCNILLAHNPVYFDDYVDWGADFVMSGHVHGGIMKLPLIGGVISPAYTLFPKYDGGIFKKGKTTMLLGRGMGAHTIPFRFFNPAELHVVTLKPEHRNN